MSGLPSWTAEHRIPSVRFRQWHGSFRTTGHGGHGPGWHESEHGCRHPFGRGFAHVLPHEWGTAGGRGCGSVKRPQKHVYFFGICAGVKLVTQFGQDQWPRRDAGSGRRAALLSAREARS